jgi:putative tricarboxylic transport membrane protein
MTTHRTPSHSPGPVLLRKDVLAGFMFMAVAVLGLRLSRDYAVGTALRMGTGFVPRLLCWILVALGAVIALRGVLTPGAAAFPPNQAHRRPLFFVTLSLLAFTFSIERLGIVIATVLLVAIGALGGRGLRTLEVSFVVLVLVLLDVGVFVWGLRLTIPVWPEW